MGGHAYRGKGYWFYSAYCVGSERDQFRFKLCKEHADTAIAGAEFRLIEVEDGAPVSYLPTRTCWVCGDGMEEREGAFFLTAYAPARRDWYGEFHEGCGGRDVAGQLQGV